MDINTAISNIQTTYLYIQPFLPMVQQYAPDLVGFVLPPVIQLLSKDIPKDAQVRLNIGGVTFNLEKRYIASLTVCALAAILLKGDTLVTGSPDQIKGSFLALFAESQIVYRMYFKDSYWSQKIGIPTLSSSALSALGAEG